MVAAVGALRSADCVFDMSSRGKTLYFFMIAPPLYKMIKHSRVLASHSLDRGKKEFRRSRSDLER